MEPELKRNKLTKYRPSYLIAGLVVLLVATMFVYLLGKDKTSNPVPKSVSQKVNFTVYYPEAKKLPKGYLLDKSSFSSNSEAIEFIVRYANNSQKIIFSEEQRPSSSDIQNFYRDHMPLNSTYKTAIGTATIGEINLEGVSSLPTNSSTWILITYSANINIQQLKQVLSSLTSS